VAVLTVATTGSADRLLKQIDSFVVKSGAKIA